MNRITMFALAGMFAAALAADLYAQQSTPGQTTQGQQGQAGQGTQGQGTQGQGTQGQGTQGQGTQGQKGQQGQAGQGTQGQQGQPGQGTQGTNYSTINQTPWFGDPATRNYLKMNDDQFNQLNKAYTNSWTTYQKGLSSLSPDLTPEQRANRMNELQRDFYNSFSNYSNKVINDPASQQRFNQLYLQYRGYDALLDPTVQQRLNLTADQRAQLAAQNQQWNQFMGTWNQSYANDPTAASNRFNEMRQQNQQRLNTILTPEQQRTWQQMTGEPYTFSPNTYYNRSK